MGTQRYSRVLKGTPGYSQGSRGTKITRDCSRREYSAGTPGYSRPTPGRTQGYVRGTLGVLEGYSRRTQGGCGRRLRHLPRRIRVLSRARHVLLRVVLRATRVRERPRRVLPPELLVPAMPHRVGVRRYPEVPPTRRKPHRAAAAQRHLHNNKREKRKINLHSCLRFMKCIHRSTL